MIIYVITNLFNGKQYVGQTSETLEKRYQRHCWPCNAGKHPITLAIQKYGKENFKIEWLACAESQEETDDLEVHYAKTLNAFAPHGYNLRAGKGRGVMSEETKRKISQANKGRVRSAEQRNNISLAHIGNKHSDETKRKLSAHFRGKSGTAYCYARSVEKNSKTYQLVNPEGAVVVITNLKKYCKENGLGYPKMNELANGKRNVYKGWTKNVP